MNGEQGFFPRGGGTTTSNNNSTGSFMSSGHNVVPGTSQFSSTSHESMANRFGAYHNPQAILSSRMAPPMHGIGPRMPNQRVMSSHSSVSQQMQMQNHSVMAGMLSQGPPSMPSRLMQPGGGSPINLSPGVQRRPMMPNENDSQRPLLDSMHHVPIDRSVSCTTQYFSSKTPEEFRKLQESGALEKPPWYLVPPIPDHLRGPSSGKSGARLHPSVMNSKSRPNSFFIDTELRNTLLNRVHATLLQADEKLASHFPESVSDFTNLVPMEKPAMWMPSSTFRFPSLCLKAFNVNDNSPYLLRAVRNCPVPLPSVQALLDKLACIQHPNLIPVRSMFTSDSLGNEACVVFVFDFVPCATTLQQRHMSDPLKLTGYASPFNLDRAARPVSAMKSAVERTMMPESHLISYFVQLLSALRYTHKTIGLACRHFDPTKILVTEGQRLRINCVGMSDLLMPIPDNEIEMFQKKDLHILGQIMVGLACGTTISVDPSMIATSLDMVRQSYSMDISNLIIQLWQEEVNNIDQAITALAGRAFDHTATLYNNTDHLEAQLTKQMQCDRLFRLVCKLATVCERNELGGGGVEWSDTEGRYLLKLFRDFVFHQIDQTGAPWLDLSHIVSCMNKLDMASPEKIYLVSREGHNVIIASFAELKRCLDESYQFLMTKQIASQQSLISDHLAKMKMEAETDGVRRS